MAVGFGSVLCRRSGSMSLLWMRGGLRFFGGVVEILRLIGRICVGVNSLVVSWKMLNFVSVYYENVCFFSFGG